MKSKKLTLALLLAVFAVWGLVLWRVWSPLAAPEIIAGQEWLPDTTVLRTADTLWLDYPDPFLDRLPLAAGPKEIQRSESFLNEPPSGDLPEEQFPVFLFRGRIRQGKRVYALLETNGSRELVPCGTLTSGFRVIRVADDSIVVVRHKKRYVIKR